MDNIIDVGSGQGYRDKEQFCLIRKEKGGEHMQLSTTYMENLPSPNYKTKQFTRSISESLPDDITKDELMKRAERQALTVETFVKNDIVRHIEEATKAG
jgi:hypothetical protein